MSSINKTLGLSLLSGLVVAVATTAGAAGSRLESQHLFLGEWVDSASERDARPLPGRCSDGYPMHHMHPCGTATGGPSGGLH